MGAPALVKLFKEKINNAHINQGRDSRLLSSFIEMEALSAIDVIALMYRFEYQADQRRDIPSFIRWSRRNIALVDGVPVILRKVDAVKLVTGHRYVRGETTYRDLMGDVQNAREHKAWVSLGERLETMCDGILGVEYGDD